MDFDNKSIEEGLKNLLKAKGTTQELTAMTKAYGSVLGVSKETLSKMESSLESQEKLSERIKRQAGFINTTLEERLVLEKLSENIKEASEDIARKQAQAAADLVLQQEMLKTGLTEEYAEQIKNYRILLEIGKISQQEYELSIKDLQAQQKVSNHLEEQAELTREMAKMHLEAREEIEKYTKGWQKTKDLAMAIAKDPQLNKTIFGGLLIKKSGEALKKMGETMQEFRKGGESVTQAFHSLQMTLNANAILLGQDTKGALEGLQESMGDVHAITEDTVKTTAGLSQAFGISAEEAGQLVGNLAQMPGMTQEAAANMAEMTGRLAISAGVKPGKVLEGMAKSTEEVAKFSAQGGESFARAAVGAAKMGVDVSKMASAAESLLDFESSITKQMEASVLLGKEINLDKARELSLNGDLAGATGEILKNIGGEAEFNQMNLLQRKALAESIGVSVADLGKMVKHQEGFTEAQKEALQQGKSLDEVLAMGSGFAGQMMSAFSGENIVMMLSAVESMKNLGIFTKIASMAQAAWTAIKGAFTTATAAETATTETNNIVKQQQAIVNEELAVSQASVGTASGFAAGPMLAFGAAVLMVGAGIGVAAAGISLLVDSFAKMPIDNLKALPLALLGIGNGLISMGVGGITAAPAIGMLLALAAVAPVLQGLGTTLGGIFGGEIGGGKAEKTVDDLYNAINTLATNIKAQPVVVEIDGGAIVRAVRKNSNVTGVR